MRGTTLFAAAVATFVAGAASAGIIVFNFGLDGLQEVPPTPSPGTGMATVTVDPDTLFVDITGSYAGLLAPVTAAHLHGLAPPGANAGVIFGLMHTGGTTGTFMGSGFISAAQMTGLLNGHTYINVHTSSFPGGEIRGQVVPAPAGLLLLAAAPLVARRRRA